MSGKNDTFLSLFRESYPPRGENGTQKARIHISSLSNDNPELSDDSEDDQESMLVECVTEKTTETLTDSTAVYAFQGKKRVLEEQYDNRSQKFQKK